MRLIYILALLIVVNSSYSKKECYYVLEYFNQGMNSYEILNMLSEDGAFLLDKIPSLLDNSYVEMGSAAGTLLYKKYVKNYVEECRLFYQREQQNKADSQENWNIISWIAFIVFIVVCFSVSGCCIVDEIERRVLKPKQK